jgi:arylsulfatase
MPPNILILMTDQQRANCLSCAGHPVVQTPHMDRLAREGIRFARAYTPSPLCIPARSSFLSGLYCHTHQKWENAGLESRVNGFDPEPVLPTYPRELRQVGYHTCHIGKAHLHGGTEHLDEWKPFMNTLGWDDVFETPGPLWAMRLPSLVSERWSTLGCLELFREDYRQRRQKGGLAAAWPSPLPEGETLDDIVGRLALEYLQSYARSEPFLVFVGFPGPHDPWDPPRAWAEHYKGIEMDPPKPITEPGFWVPEAAAAHQRALQNNQLGLTPQSIANIRLHYYAKISHIDSWIGRILDVLEQRGLLEETFIVFWSDHGEMLGDKGRLHKSVFYEEAVHVPLILRPPRYTHAGAVSHGLTTTIDLYPTLLDLADSLVQYRGFGTSLMPVLDDHQQAIHEEVCSEIAFRTMIFDGRYKLVIDNATATLLKLYNLQEDPQEAVNLVGDGGTDEIVAHLKDRLLCWSLRTHFRKSAESGHQRGVPTTLMEYFVSKKAAAEGETASTEQAQEP